MTASRRIARSLASLRVGFWVFFLKRCLAGFPWFWPARPVSNPTMVEARRIVRRQFGRNYHPLLRRLAQVLVTLAWPPALVLNFWQVRQWLGLGPAELLLVRKRVPGALWAAIRHNILPSEYYAYGLWLPERRTQIDSYLYSNE